MEILDEKVNAHLPYYSTLKKFWNGFFQLVSDFSQVMLLLLLLFSYNSMAKTRN